MKANDKPLILEVPKVKPRIGVWYTKVQSSKKFSRKMKHKNAENQ